MVLRTELSFSADVVPFVLHFSTPTWFQQSNDTASTVPLIWTALKLNRPCGTQTEVFRSLSSQSPQTACRADRLGIVTVVPLSVTRCLFLNSLSVRVIVSRVEPTHSAICSWVKGTLICAASDVFGSSEDQFRNALPLSHVRSWIGPPYAAARRRGRIENSAVC